MARGTVSAFLVVTSTILAAILTGSVVRAGLGGSTHLESPKDLPVGAERTVVWVIPQDPPRVLKIVSESKNAPHPDEFTLTYAMGTFSLEYERVAGGPVTSNYSVTLKSLLEWDDKNGNGFVDEDEILEEFPLGGTAFGGAPIQHVQSAMPSGAEVHSFLIHTNNEEVTVNLTVSETFLQLSPQKILTPMEVKLTFDIRHTFVRLGARLALEVAMDTDDKVKIEDHSWDEEHDFSEGDRAINITSESDSESSSVFFAWSTTATVDGVSGPVAVTGPESEGGGSGYQLYIAYPRGSNPARAQVIHDPVMGIVSAAYASLLALPPPRVLQPDYLLYGASLAAVAGLVAASVVLVRRRRAR